jgi:hypothetical protein
MDISRITKLQLRTKHMEFPTVLFRLGDWALVRKAGSLVPHWVSDPQGSADNFPGGIEFHTHLAATHLRDNRLVKAYDLGSGLVTNVGVLALANDFAWSPTNAPHNVFRTLKYHASGTGATAAAATDIKLQTASGNGGQTPVSGTQVLVSAANLQKYQSVATIAYTGGEAVTEWGFFGYDSTVPATSALSDATGSPFTAGSATTGTVTGTPLTASSASAMGQQMTIIENTGNATPHWGLITSNTTSLVTVPAWYKVSDGTAAGVTPANTNTYVFRPIMWDHKVFSAINVVNGDSIQFTYTLTVSSGG